MDGDVEMKTRGERGGKRYQQRKRKAMGLDDVEMQEVEVRFHATMLYIQRCLRVVCHHWECAQLLVI